MALPPSLVPNSFERDRSGAIGERKVALAQAKLGQCWMTWATVWGLAPHSGQWVGLRGWKCE